MVHLTYYLMAYVQVHFESNVRDKEIAISVSIFAVCVYLRQTANIPTVLTLAGAS